MRPSTNPVLARRRRQRLGLAIALAALIAASCASTAQARGLNRRSEHAALHAYNRYLRSLIIRSKIGSRRDAAFLANVHSSCLGYLTPFANQISTPAGHALGVEIGADVAIRFTSAAGRPLRHLSSRLLRLRWSSPTAETAVADFVAAEHRLLRLGTSDLCADAIRLGYHPGYASRTTRHFVARFNSLTSAVAQALSGFIAVLEAHEHRRDRRLIAKINHHTAVYQRTANSIEATDQATLIQDLGLQPIS